MPPQDDCLPPGCTQADVDGPQPDDDADRDHEDSPLNLMARTSTEDEEAALFNSGADDDDDNHPTTESVLDALQAPRALGRPDHNRWPQKREGMAEMLAAAAADLATFSRLASDDPAAYRRLLERAADRYRGAIALFESEEEVGHDADGDNDAGDGGD